MAPGAHAIRTRVQRINAAGGPQSRPPAGVASALPGSTGFGKPTHRTPRPRRSCAGGSVLAEAPAQLRQASPKLLLEAAPDGPVEAGALEPLGQERLLRDA